MFTHSAEQRSNPEWVFWKPETDSKATVGSNFTKHKQQNHSTSPVRETPQTHTCTIRVQSNTIYVPPSLMSPLRLGCSTLPTHVRPLYIYIYPALELGSGAHPCKTSLYIHISCIRAWQWRHSLVLILARRNIHRWSPCTLC